jgi:hypothetical protein
MKEAEINPFVHGCPGFGITAMPKTDIANDS